MRKSLFVFASVATWATISNAVAQYVPLPGNVSPQPGYVPGPGPGYTPPGECAKAFSEETCRRRERATESAATRVIDPNRVNRECPIGFSAETCLRRSGALDVTDPEAGECAIGFSEETCRRRGQKYNPPRKD